MKADVGCCMPPEMEESHFSSKKCVLNMDWLALSWLACLKMNVPAP
jgi:hypothetical protein